MHCDPTSTSPREALKAVPDTGSGATRLPSHLSPAEVQECAQNIQRHSRALHVAVCANDFVLRATYQMYKVVLQGGAAMHRVVKFPYGSDDELRQHIAANAATLKGLLEQNRRDLQSLCSRKAFEAARQLRPDLTKKMFRQELWTRLQRRRVHAARLLAKVPLRPAILDPIVKRYREMVESMKQESAENKSSPNDTARANQKRRLFEFVMTCGMSPDAASRNVTRIDRHQTHRDVEVNKLVVTNQKLVAKIARNFRHTRVDPDDLKQGGVLGLIRAARDYDWRLGLQFSTYATYWIRHGVQRVIDKEGPYGCSSKLRQLRAEVLETREGLSYEYQRQPTAQQIVDYLNAHPGLKESYSVKDVQRALLYRMPSIDESVSVKGDKTISRKDRLPVPQPGGSELAGARLDTQAQRQAIVRAISRFRPREQDLLFRRFGLHGKEWETLDEVAAHYGISRERVRQIERKLIEKLRKRPIRDGLERVFDMDVE